MLAFLGSRFGEYCIVAFVVLSLVGGVVIKFRVNANTINDLRDQLAALSAQTAALQATNEALQADVNRVQRVQQETDRALASVRVQAASASKLIHNRSLSAASQGQINQETADAFKRLEDATRE